MTPATELLIPGPAGKPSVRTKGLDRSPKTTVILVEGGNASGQFGYDFSFDRRSDCTFIKALMIVREGDDDAHLQNARHPLGKTTADFHDG